MARLMTHKLMRCGTVLYGSRNEALLQAQCWYSTDTIDKKGPSVIVEKDDHITLIGLNRENNRNSIDRATARSLCDAFDAFEADNFSPVAVLHGVGGSLCAGNDVVELEQQLENNNLESLLQLATSVGPTRRQLRKPVVCSVSGYCVASGLELALLCDLRVMENTAIMGFFNRYAGLPLTNGGTARLSKLVGLGQALDLLLTGRRVSGDEAFRMGLANRLVATGTALGQAVNVAFSIAKFPMAALQRDRSTLYANMYARRWFSEAIQNETNPLANAVRQEIEQGVMRFKNSKRKGEKTDSWQLKMKPIPDWEMEEISHEKEANKTGLKVVG